MSGIQNKKAVLRLDSKEEPEEKREIRLDYMPLRDKIKLTPQGFARVPAALTRTGVFTYIDRDTKKKVRELRHPDDVLHPDSMATMQASPLVVSHKIETGVTAANWKEVQVGLTSDVVTREDGKEEGETFLLNQLLVQDGPTIEKVNSGELRDISPAYTCVIDPTPGTYHGKPYDQRQTFIRYNNFALGPPGWGREGAKVATRLDAVYSEIDATEKALRGKEKQMDYIEVTLRLDGVDYVVKVPQALATNLKTSHIHQQQRLDAAEARISELEGIVQVKDTELAEVKTRLDSAVAPEAIEALVAERTEVFDKAKKIDPEMRLDGLSLDEIRLAVLKKRGVDMTGFESNSDRIAGAFQALSVNAPKPVEYPHDRRPGQLNTRLDGEDKNELTPAQAVRAARDRMIRRGRGEEVKA